VPVRLRFGHHTRRLAVMGLPKEPKLFRLLDADQQPVPLPEDGLVLTAKLAEVLGCKVGDTITVEVLEGKRPVRQAVVAGLLTNFTESAAYMDIAALHRLMKEGNVCSGAFLAVDPNHSEDIYLQLKKTPRVAGVTVKQAMLRTFHETLAENLLLMRTFNVIFASVIAFGVIYNAARISLAERGRELATLRVLGFTRAEISFILLGEMAVLTLAALPPGLAFGYGLSLYVTQALDTETQRFPAVIYPSTYAYAAVVTLIAAFVSGMIVRRRLDRLDLVAVLKARE
jgi:putative ABC transport system permease protein